MNHEEKIKFWTNFAFNKMRKDKSVMPTALLNVLQMDDFRISGVTEEELRQSIKERFAEERKLIVSKIKQEWDETK